MRAPRFAKGQAAAGAAALAVAALSASSASAAAQWIFHDKTAAAAERTIDGASDWFDANNWTNGYIAVGADVRAYFYEPGTDWLSSGVRYVKLDRDLTIGLVSRWFAHSRTQSVVDSNRRVILAGDNVLTLSSSASAVEMRVIGIYGTLRIASSKGQPAFYTCDFCGPFVNETSYAPLFDSYSGIGYHRFRRDLWADGNGAGITNFAPTSVSFDGSQAVVLVAPEGSDGVAGTWSLEEGSAIAHRVGDAHALSVGTAVTGEGVPAGAYVKRVYSDSIIELSAAATASSGAEGTALDFAAFRPRAYQRIDSYSTVYHSLDHVYNSGFWPMKHSPEDEMTVEMFNLRSQSGMYHFYVDCEDGYLPGRLVLHNTSAFNRDLILGMCEVEFAATTNNTTAGFPNTVRMRPSTSGGAEDTARVVVPEGVEARFGSLANVIGTFIKDGAGSLTAPVLSNEVFAAGSTGTLVVESGSLALECAEGSPILVDTFAITNGATFTVPACGFEAKKVFAEAGAVVNGTGLFYTGEMTDLSGISFGEGVTVVRIPAAGTTVDSSGFFWETNVAVRVSGHPALWFDASKVETFEFSDARTITWGRAVRTWYDVRGEEYGYARCYIDTRPQYLFTNLLGQARFVHTGSSSSTETKNREALGFNKSLTGIRSVFKVINTRSGGSVYLGGSNRARSKNAVAGDRLQNYTAPVFYNVPELYTNSLAFYVNGDQRDWRTGYPFGANTSGLYNNNPDLLVPMVTEMHFPDATTTAGGFGYRGKHDNGYDFIYECLIYTNELTEVERLSVRKYLMNKWCDASLNYKPDAVAKAGARDVGSGAAYRIDKDETLVLSDLSGDGALAKYGEGTLAVEKASSNALHVACGTVSIRAKEIPLESELPGDPYLHLDASDGDSLVVEDGKVASWADVRGEGHPVATALNAGKGPGFEENALNDMPAVDFGAHTYGTIAAYGATCPTLVYDAVSNAHTVIQVLDSSQGGGALLGWKTQGQASVASSMMYGLYRNNKDYGGDWTKPIVDTASYASSAYDLRNTDQPGGARVRLNGVDVDAGATGFTGGYDLVSVVAYKPIRASAIAQLGIDSKNFTFGGQKVCELLIYTNVLSRSEVKAVEAYLSKKWFNRVPAGYEQTAAKSVSVDAGAVLEVWGGGPLSTKALSGAGTVSGSVSLEDGAVLRLEVGEDGSLEVPNVTGGLNLVGGGTVVLSGDVRKLAGGAHPLAAVNSGDASGWTVVCEAETARSLALSSAGGTLSLVVYPAGAVIVVQ